jgi:hypothetical protein
MKLQTYVWMISLLVLVFQNRGLSQEKNSQSDLEKTLIQSRETKSTDDGLRKVSLDSNQLDIDISHELETEIEAAVDNAIRSLEFRFGDLNVHPVQIDLSDLNLKWEKLEVDFDFPHINIDHLEPDLEDFDFNISIDEDF